MSDKSDLLKRISEGYEKNQDIIDNKKTPLKPTAARGKVKRKKSTIPMDQRIDQSFEKIQKKRERLTQEDIESEKNIPIYQRKTPLPEKILFRISEVNIEILHEYIWKKISLKKILRFEEIGAMGECRRFYTLYSNTGEFSSISIKRVYLGGRPYYKPAALFERLCLESQQGREFFLFRDIDRDALSFMVLFAKTVNKQIFDFDDRVLADILARNEAPKDLKQAEIEAIKEFVVSINTRHTRKIVENLLKSDIDILNKVAVGCKKILRAEDAMIPKSSRLLLREVEIEIGRRMY